MNYFHLIFEIGVWCVAIIATGTKNMGNKGWIIAYIGALVVSLLLS